jgi:hypothetical protein
LQFWVADRLHSRLAVMSRVHHAAWAGLQAAGITLPLPKTAAVAANAQVA